MDIEALLTSTRSARRSLDLSAPVDATEIRDCLQIALHAANGTNQQSWRWIVVHDPDLRRELAALYEKSYLRMTGGTMVSDLLPDDDFGRLMSSTEWMVTHLADIPVHVIPCYEPYLPDFGEGGESFQLATLYGSIFPAVWNFQLALHTRGLRILHHDDAPAPSGRCCCSAGDPGYPCPRVPSTGRPVAPRNGVPTLASAANRGGRGHRYLGRPLGSDLRERQIVDADLERRLLERLDRDEIFDCIVRYARGMDRLDRQLARSAYHDGAIDDHVGFVGSVDAFLDWSFAYHANQVRHQHYVSNCHIDLDGDEAHVETYFTFIGTERDSSAALTAFGGRYVDHFERRQGRWGITVRLCLVEWATDPKSLLPSEASEMVAATGTIPRSPADSSYERPLRARRTSL